MEKHRDGGPAWSDSLPQVGGHYDQDISMELSEMVAAFKFMTTKKQTSSGTLLMSQGHDEGGMLLGPGALD